ncbi:PH domain-containing protein [Cytobacillus horneckiae]|uniref:PH domain-containing protein n=1 Tax=Cytobacillus horneckiae TaxID=549687 RepID=UPI003B8A6431
MKKRNKYNRNSQFKRNEKNPFIDSALSINKIEMNDQKYETTAISPINKGQFIQSLVEINPNIQFKR